jgi:hypothetical protein
MSATEAAVAPVAVEETKPTETAPVTDTSAPVQEAPKVEETAAPAPVRLFLCVQISLFLFYIRRLQKQKQLR